VKHQIEPFDVQRKGVIIGLFRCTRCHRRFDTPPLTMDCPGVPILSWQPWPEGLYTIQQLAEKGYKPGDKVAGVLPLRQGRWCKMYHLEDAIPKKVLSDEQRDGLARAQKTRLENRTCRQCGSVRSHKSELNTLGLCERCVRKAAVAQMVEEWLERDFVVLDCETTGLDAQAEIVQLGVIDSHRQTLIDTFIKPTQPIDETGIAYQINRIGNAQVADAPTFPQLYPHLRDVLHGRLVIAYNVAFDRTMLRQNQALHHLPEAVEPEWQCAMLLTARWFGDWSNRHKSYRWQPLELACQHFKISVHAPEHSAVGDCLRALGVLQALRH